MAEKKTGSNYGAVRGVIYWKQIGWDRFQQAARSQDLTFAGVRIMIWEDWEMERRMENGRNRRRGIRMVSLFSCLWVSILISHPSRTNTPRRANTYVLPMAFFFIFWFPLLAGLRKESVVLYWLNWNWHDLIDWLIYSFMRVGIYLLGSWGIPLYIVPITYTLHRSSIFFNEYTLGRKAERSWR